MSYHLGDKHKVFNKKKEQQLKIDDQIKKFTPHKEPKQQYLRNESIRFYYTPLIEDDNENEEGIEDDDDELEDDDEESDDENEGESESDEEEEDEQRIRPNVTTRQQSQHQQLQQQSQQQQSQHQQHQQQPQRQHHQQQLNTASIINKVQKEIYGALFDYWNDPPMAMLLATILDPRCKRTHASK
ncbi:hypothetical protein RCL_jg10206.t1 [Rhizophagus clarus]|uniref:Uncharacterized protein n=1 Tax=Rhizophagus clarus TaxID=94130 RepID=A0A8H3QCX7_9GLOM|nr:hypothetical protein RCL_jg10206.t1 [Rhizophagus clarus]